jgi:hypothetical protein
MHFVCEQKRQQCPHQDNQTLQQQVQLEITKWLNMQRNSIGTKYIQQLYETKRALFKRRTSNQGAL